MFKDYEMTLYEALGVLFALSVLVAVLDKKISHGIFFFLFAVVLFVLLVIIKKFLVLFANFASETTGVSFEPFSVFK